MSGKCQDYQDFEKQIFCGHHVDDLSSLCKLEIRSELRAEQLEVLVDLKLRMNSDQVRVNEMAR